MGHRLGLTTGAQIRVCKTPCLSTGPAVPLTGTETVQRDYCCHGIVKPGCRIVGRSSSEPCQPLLWQFHDDIVLSIIITAICGLSHTSRWIVRPNTGSLSYVVGWLLG